MWDKLFIDNPERYIKVIDTKTKELIEVHDKETGVIWFKINDTDRWMFIV